MNKGRTLMTVKTMKLTLIFGALLVLGPTTHGDRIITQNDDFVSQGPHLFQQMVDDNGKGWQRPASPFNLDVLCNDKLLLGEQETCRDVVKTFMVGDVNNDRINKTKTFEEVGKVSSFSPTFVCLSHNDTICE